MSEAAPDLSKSQPRYVLLAQRLAEDIAQERYPVGALLPAEAELCNLYNVSRFTVREALRRIQALGLVSRQQGVGTRVVAASPAQGYVHAVSSVEELLQNAQSTRLSDIELEDVVADADLATALRCREGQRFLRITGVRIDSTEPAIRPTCSLDIYVADAFAGIRDHVRTHQGAIADLIEARYGQTTMEIVQELSAVALKQSVADRLHVPPGSPGLKIERWYLGQDGRPFQISISYHPGERNSYSMRLRREGLG